MPFIMGSVTPSAAFAAMAASMAEPPCARICAPATEACTWLVATMPYCVTTIERASERSSADRSADMEDVSSKATTIRIEMFMLHLRRYCKRRPVLEVQESLTDRNHVLALSSPRTFAIRRVKFG